MAPFLFLENIMSNEHPTRQVQYYGNILDALQRAIPGSVHIAGGAVRDTLLDRPIKDIDIFVPHTAGEEAAALLRSQFGYVKVGEWKQYLDFSDPLVERVAKFEKADETIPVCLIGLTKALDPHDNVARFDFGVCMAAWAGGDSMITSNAFKRDIESKTFTLCRADNYAQFAYSMVRFKKLTADRYKDWKLSVPSQFEELAKEHTFRKHWYRAGGHFGFENFPQVLRPKDR
jgi:Poly A polymerase head domain